MEKLNIIQKYILVVSYLFPCIYIAIKSLCSSLGLFKKIMKEDSVSNICGIGLYVFLGQLSIITGCAFENMLSVNLVQDIALSRITNFQNRVFIIYVICLNIISFVTKFDKWEERITLDAFKTTVFKLCFSLICIQVFSYITRIIANGIYNIQISIYENIIEANHWYTPIFILFFSIWFLSILFSINKCIPILTFKHPIGTTGTVSSGRMDILLEEYLIDE